MYKFDFQLDLSKRVLSKMLLTLCNSFSLNEADLLDRSSSFSFYEYVTNLIEYFSREIFRKTT